MSSDTSALTQRKTLQRRMPDFFIVGHPKCGTTALYRMLRRQPQIFMPDLKETRFFAREHPYPGNPGRHPDTLEEYLSLFDPAQAGQRVGEASPQYLGSRVAASRIAELAPDARIIAILREPASFLRSFHLELLRDHVETEPSLRRAIALEELRRREKGNPKSPGYGAPHSPGLVYSEHVRYVEQLRRYHEHFLPGHVLVLIYDDFLADNEAAVRRVLEFLDIDDASPVEAMAANPTVRVRSVRMYGLVRSLYLGRGPLAHGTKTAIKALTPERVRRDALKLLRRRVLYGKPQPPDEEYMLELRRRFKSEVIAVSEYLGRDLVTLWGYDRVD